MKCLQCNQNKAINDPQYGILPCEICQALNTLGPSPRRGVEFTTQEIKEQRNEYLKDIIQAYRGDVLSKEYLEIYGTKGIKPTKKQLKNAKYVWGDLPNIKNVHKTK